MLPGESVAVVTEDDDSTKKGRPCISKSILEIILLVLSILFLIAAVVFIVLYFTQAKPANICTSRKCFLTVGEIFKKMDPTVDPCDNFADYACGGFYRDVHIHGGLDTINAFTELRENSKHIVEDILNEPISDDDEEYLKKAKTFYLSCSDEETIESQAALPYLNTDFSQDWPTLNKSWNPDSFDLKKNLAKYAPLTPLLFFYMGVNVGLKESSKNTIYILAPDYVKQMTKSVNLKILSQLGNIYSELAIALGAESRTAVADALGFRRFLLMLSAKKNVFEQDVQVVALKDLATHYPSIDFGYILQAFFQGTEITLQDDEEIIIDNPKYFKHLEGVIQATDSRVLQNVIGYSFANHIVPSLSMQFRKFHVLYKLKNVLPTANYVKDCVRSSHIFGRALGKEYVKRAFSEELRSTLVAMFDTLVETFTKVLKDADWLKKETRKEALLKMENMVRKIGYPDSNYAASDINEYYKSATVSNDSYFQNHLNMHTFQRIKMLEKLNKPAESIKWPAEPEAVNANYIFQSNEIVFPAGVMQPPLYSDIFPASFTYGGIGSLIGHEISHAFDATGANFDHSGNLRNWWQVEDFIEFQRRSECVIDQYSNFEHPQVKMKLNGTLTETENVADMVGIKEAFRAYKSSGTNEEPLPGLDLTTEQQFFLAFSQMWCAKWTNESLKESILEDYHSPGRFRIIGTLQNTREFAKAFDCRVGSYMNPSEKCVVW